MMRYIIFPALLLVSACSGSAPPAADPPTALIGVARAVPGAISENIIIYGVADPRQDGRSDLVAPVEAIVASLDVAVGSTVRRGQVVARLRASPSSRVDLARSTNDAVLAEQSLARAQRLRADGLVSDAEVESARAAMRTAQTVRTSLGNQTQRLTLAAPIAGVVQSVVVANGDLVPAGTTVATITAIGNNRARFTVAPGLLRRLAVGMPVQVIPADGTVGFTAAIKAINPYADPVTRLAVLYIDIPSASGIAAGEQLQGAVSLAGPQTITVPYTAILDEAGQAYVFLIVNGTARRRNVRLGAADGRNVAVLDGLAAGDVVATAGGTALQDGVRVRTR